MTIIIHDPQGALGSCFWDLGMMWFLRICQGASVSWHRTLEHWWVQWNCWIWESECCEEEGFSSMDSVGYRENGRKNKNWLVVSNIFYIYFHPYLGKFPILTNIFQMGWNHQPENVDDNDWIESQSGSKQNIHKRSSDDALISWSIWIPYLSLVSPVDDSIKCLNRMNHGLGRWACEPDMGYGFFVVSDRVEWIIEMFKGVYSSFGTFSCKLMKHSLKRIQRVYTWKWMVKRRQAFPFGFFRPIFWGKRAVSFRVRVPNHYVHSNSRKPSFSSAGAKHRGRNIKRPPAGRPCWHRGFFEMARHWRSSKLNKDLRTNHTCLGM